MQAGTTQTVRCAPRKSLNTNARNAAIVHALSSVHPSTKSRQGAMVSKYPHSLCRRLNTRLNTASRTSSFYLGWWIVWIKWRSLYREWWMCRNRWGSSCSRGMPNNCIIFNWESHLLLWRDTDKTSASSLCPPNRSSGCSSFCSTIVRVRGLVL